MRDYNRKKGKYILPRAVYNQTIWLIRDYYRIKEIADNIIHQGNSEVKEIPKTNAILDTTGDKVSKRDKYINYIKAINEALKEIPCEYRVGVWNNIMFGSSYPLDAHRNTYTNQKSKFIKIVAEKFNII